MNRRGFLGSILAACAAPAIVRADSLMRIVPMDTLIFRRPVPFALADLEFSSADLALSLERFSRTVIQPAMKRLADEIDHDSLRALSGPQMNSVIARAMGPPRLSADVEAHLASLFR